MLPEFDANGNLPPGEHPCSWQEFSDRFAINAHRRTLLEGLTRALLNLKDAGCTRVWMDGSFVTSKENPGDYDGMWLRENVDPQRLDSIFLDSEDMRYGSPLQKAIYLGELFPYHEQHVKQFIFDRHVNLKGMVVLNPQEIES